MASMALHGSGILFLLTCVLLSESAQAQRIGPLVRDNQQRSKALSAEREEALRPPSLQLSLPLPAEVNLPPLGPDDLQRLQPQRGRPPVIGVHRRLPQGALKLSLSAGGVKSTAERAWQSTEAGRLWRLKLTSPSARAMRVHFRDFAIGAGRLWLHSEDGQAVGPYAGSGRYGDGDFWSGIVFGDSLTIEYLPDPAAAGEAVPFRIVAISHIWGDVLKDGAEDGGQWPKAAREGSDRPGGSKLLPGPIGLAVGPPSRKARLTKSTMAAIQSVKRSASLQQPRPKAARSLTSGRPVTFSRGPVDSPTLFHGDFSYQLEVPDDATRVTFTLESDADVALLVRYGEDNDIQDGMPVYDYAADEVFEGTEEIEIDPQSDPPLQAGTYFVSVGVLATGVEVNCTLTAGVEREGGTPPPPSGRTLRPGQPVSFQRGPVDSSTLFVGPNSFLLEVPEDATSVTFTLESDADVELLVRFGEDNDVEDGRLATDHRHRNRTGNERIVITSQSDPPLRAGTYFVSVAVYATGVVVNCTLTAEVEREAPPPISGGTLTPGQPADFRLGPVDSPTLFTGGHSFRFEAPENATRITFTLESVDPDVDVDLYVRFGEDNTVQDGKPVSDHFSRGFTGNERIGITRRSDPPLQAGTYFVSILVFGEGVVAEGTLTATVETDAEDCHLDVTCYPEWSSSATGVALMVIETSDSSSVCSGTLLNNRRQDLTPYFLTAAHCVATEEEARSVTALWSYQTRTCNGDLPDLRSVPRTEGAGLISALGGGGRNPDGDLTLLQLDGDLPSGIVFQGWDADPQPFGAQVTGIHHPASADWGRFKRISFGQIISESDYITSDDTYFNVSYPVGQGYTEPGSSGSAVFSNSETVVGALSGGDIVGYACPTEPVVDYFTHFSALYPHIRPFIDSTLPEISGGALAPRQPATFRLGPVDSPMLFSGDSSFQVEVPENTARVTFTLQSVDPDVNVDLYVRYKEDNAVQGGSVVSDYSATGPTGNERIVVTPQSAPPLRAGTYYVSLMLRTTRAVAEVTLTAQFDVAPPAGGRTYYFPHLAVGAGWQTTLTYINYSAEEVSCRTEFLSDQGTPLMVSFPSLGPDVRRTDMLPPGGSVHEETDVGLSAPPAAGWARATCSGPVKASLLFRRYDSTGVPMGEAGVNAAAVASSRFVTFAEQAPGQDGTGVAYANPSDTAAMVTFTAKDAAGRTLDSVDQTLIPGGHGAENMARLFDLSSFTGSLEITSTEPIVSLSINAEAAPIFSSLPPGELDPSAQGPTMYYFPHLAVGASWQTTITYINYSSQEVSCQTEFLSDQGTPLMVSFPGRGPDTSRRDVLPPRGSVHEETDVGLSAPPAAGWARAACSGPVKASLLFRQYGSEGVPTGEAGVNAAAVASTRFVTFAEQREGQLGTGVAYANPSDTSTVVVTFTAKDAAGRTLDSVDQTLMPRGHGAENMERLFDLSSFTGSLEITSREPIVSLSLNAEAAPVFSSLPPGEVDAAEIPD
ncbi:MAG: trypsin-like serine protease [Bryobacterales bacterium]|nr:trypsin-like serine protease [Bryobacterales bacterium]